MHTFDPETEDSAFAFTSDMLRGAGELKIDGIEFASYLTDKGVSEENPPTMDHLVDGVKKCAWGPCDVETLTRHQLNSIGVRVLKEMERLGNLQGPPQSSQLPMAAHAMSGPGETQTEGN